MERYICSTCYENIERGVAHRCLAIPAKPLPATSGTSYTPTPSQGGTGGIRCSAENTPVAKATGIRHDQGKGRISLLPGRAIESVMQVGEFGSKKYGDHNYRGGMPVTKYLDAAYRHAFVQWLFKGEDNDAESGLPHLAHAAWNVLAALEQMLLKPELDNRVGKGAGNEKS
jgi:hypothetical protein